jgi:predicted O-methyltransferase YrrM
MEQYLKKHFRAHYDRESPVKIHRMTRDALPALFNYLGFKKGAEIGVMDGTHSLLYCQGIPGLELICVDSWVPFQTYRSGRVMKAPHVMDHPLNYELAQKNLAGYNVTFMKMYSMDAVKQIPENSLDFVYIDANHYYKYVMEDLIEWSKRVRSGGIVSGHDYCLANTGDVIPAVNEYVQNHGIKRWFLTDERRTKSYFWVKP